MATFPQPPTFVAPVGQDPVTGKSYFEPAWLQWFLDFAQVLTNAGGSSGINHEDLGGLSGGSVGNHWHLTQAQHDQLVDGPGAAVVTPAVGASPWKYQNATGHNASVIIIGGTVTNVEISRDDATYYSAGAAATAVTIGAEDYIRITYAVAPTVALFPL